MASRKERADKRLERLESKDLPYSIESAKLLDMVPELDREKGLGRVLRELMEATQGNFDHLRNEAKRSTDYHNEHVEDSNFLKDDLVPHEHPGFLPKSQNGYDVFDEADLGHWIEPFCVGSAHTAGVSGYGVPTMVPVFIDKPTTIIQLRFEVIAPLPATQQDVKMWIYAGDADGNWPGTLLLDLTGSPVLCSTTGFKYTSEFELEVGPGWYWFGLGTTRTDSVDDLNIWSFDNGWNSVPHSEFRQGSFSPFPWHRFNLDHGFDDIFLAISMFEDVRDVPGPPDPLPEQWLDHLNDIDEGHGISTPFYNSYAPIIEYRAR